MPANFLPTAAEYLRILPELILTIGGVLVMLLEGMRAEGHQRVVGPLGAIAFTLVGLVFLLTGPFDRKGQTMRMIGAVAVVVALQAAALGVMSLASKDLAYIPAMYAVALLPIPVALYILLAPQWRRPVSFRTRTA